MIGREDRRALQRLLAQIRPARGGELATCGSRPRLSWRRFESLRKLQCRFVRSCGSWLRVLGGILCDEHVIGLDRAKRQYVAGADGANGGKLRGQVRGRLTLVVADSSKVLRFLLYDVRKTWQ